MGIDFSQQGLSRMTCRSCTASHVPCGNFDSNRIGSAPRRGCARGGGARSRAKAVQDRGRRLVRVRAAPQRSARIRQRASAVHGRRAFVHAPLARAYDVLVRCFEKGLSTRYTRDILAFSLPLIVEEAQLEGIFGTVAQVLRETE
jgi:hypothetical protein